MSIGPLVGRSPAFRRLSREVDAAARLRLPVLVHGETGTGKEAVARSIHERGPRNVGAFVAVNCGALPESLVESELFGAMQGAFTGAVREQVGLFVEASGGTLLLDEVGDLPAGAQVKLLRVVQEGRVRPIGSTRERPIDLRLVAASHRDLEARVEAGTFRRDLLHRLDVIRIHIPPLRDRPEDLDVIADALLDRIARRDPSLGRPELSRDARSRLRIYDWPGNVRELEAVLARAAFRSERGVIESAHLDIDAAEAWRPRGGPPRRRSTAAPRVDAEDLDTAGPREPLEVRMIRIALDSSGGRVAGAARLIGWSRQKLYRRISRLGLDRASGVPDLAQRERTAPE